MRREARRQVNAFLHELQDRMRLSDKEIEAVVDDLRWLRRHRSLVSKIWGIVLQSAIWIALAAVLSHAWRDLVEAAGAVWNKITGGGS